MGRSENRILVFERKRLPSESFIPVDRSAELVERLVDSSRWMSRPRAERSRRWVQPIPCALVRQGDQYMVLRRIRDTRSDLRSRVTLLAGGHIDYRPDSPPVSELFEDTLRRELLEEIGIRAVREIRPVGLVVDQSSLEASRHLAFVYEVAVDDAIRVRAGEEFSLNSTFSSTFITRTRLPNFESRFDPWSGILCARLLSRELVGRLTEEFVRQLSLPVSV